MSDESVRCTLYIDEGLHQRLRMRAAATHRSMSDLVNVALEAALNEETAGLSGRVNRFGEQSVAYETPVRYEDLLARLKADLHPARPHGIPAEELIQNFRHLPQVDPVQFRADIDSILDPSL